MLLNVGTCTYAVFPHSYDGGSATYAYLSLLRLLACAASGEKLYITIYTTYVCMYYVRTEKKSCC